MQVEKIMPQELEARIQQTKSDIKEYKELVKELEYEKQEIERFQDKISGNIIASENNLLRLLSLKNHAKFQNPKWKNIKSK